MRFQRGSVLIQLGRHVAAEREYRAVLAAEPNDAVVHALLAFCLERQKKYSQAIAVAKQAIALRPDLPVGYSALATACVARGPLRDAASAIKQAIALEPLNAIHRGIQAAINLRQRDWKAALEAANTGLAIDPDEAGCVNARGVALTNLGRQDEAISANVASLNRNPANAVLHVSQGWALLTSGDRNVAIEHFREALRLDPNLRSAKLALFFASLRIYGPFYWKRVYPVVQKLANIAATARRMP